MGTAPQRSQIRENAQDGPGLRTGEYIDDFERRAQSRSNADAVSSNLTNKGAWYHGIEQGTRLSVIVFEEGIWIAPMEDDESK